MPMTPKRHPTISALPRSHSTGRNWARAGARHESVEVAFPPLIKGRCAGRGQGCPEQDIHKRTKSTGSGAAEIKTNRGGNEDQKRQPRFDQLGEIGHAGVASFRGSGRPGSLASDNPHSSYDGRIRS